MREKRKRKLVMALTVDALIGSGPLSGLVTELSGRYPCSVPELIHSLSAARGALSGSTSLLRLTLRDGLSVDWWFWVLSQILAKLLQTRVRL
ncbi:unnamed protein product [Fusarium venenatum]|uniref:Uncharacterized protein n=1 Tax=Fusarium venenatum TaxID=56646 RepID=A0A2L2SNZ1_9HYPO|nr:uncharacterized protein FVRRES_12097 [Fusarium venenatum]CEI39406.1 unnamed protein product [Fusarium venenatum]